MSRFCKAAGTRARQMFAAVLAWAVPFLAFGQTSVSGVIASDTRWSLENSPYLVSGDIVLQNGARLSIDPGVSIHMGADTHLLIQSGSVLALGTPQKRIHVLSEKPYRHQEAAPGDWGRWVFLPGTTGSRLEHVLIEHGRGLFISGSSPELNFVELRHHAGAAITIDLEASPSGQGNAASGNTINGILVPAGDITGQVRWKLRGMPYLIEDGAVSVGVSPSITGVTPAVVERGQTTTLTVTGTRLETLSTLQADPPGLTFNIFSGGSATQRYVQVEAAPDAPIGPVRLQAQTDAGDIRADAQLAVSVTAQTYSERVLSMGPLAYWPLDEDSGTLAKDHSGNGFHGTFTGTPITFRGKVLRPGHPGAVGFSVGSAGIAKVVAPNAAAIRDLMNPGKSATIVMWYSNAAYTTYNWLMSLWDYPAAGTCRWRISGQAYPYAQSPHNTNTIGCNKMTQLGDISFLVFRKSVETQKYMLFHNGSWCALVGAWNDPTRSGGYPLEFPATGSWNYYGMRGYMSDVALFERALSDEEVELLYTGAASTP